MLEILTSKVRTKQKNSKVYFNSESIMTWSGKGLFKNGRIKTEDIQNNISHYVSESQARNVVAISNPYK